MLCGMSALEPPRPPVPVPGPLRRAPLWRKLVIATASALPVLGLLVAIPFANRPGPIVLGLPFLQFWTTSCALLTGACLSVVFILDPRNAEDRGAGQGETSC